MHTPNTMTSLARLIQTIAIFSSIHTSSFFFVAAADDDDDNYVLILRNHTGESEDESFNPFENIADDLLNLPLWQDLVMFLVILVAFAAVCRRCHALQTNTTHQLLAQHDDDNNDEMELIERNNKKKKARSSGKYNPHDPLKELKMAVDFLEKRAQKQGGLKKKAKKKRSTAGLKDGLTCDTSAVANMPAYKDDPLAAEV